MESTLKNIIISSSEELFSSDKLIDMNLLYTYIDFFTIWTEPRLCTHWVSIN